MLKIIAEFKRYLAVLFLFAGVFMSCTLLFGVLDAKAGSTGQVVIEEQNGECDIDFLNFNDSDLSIDAEGRGRVTVKPNGDTTGTCDFTAPDELKPPSRDVNTSFDCYIKIEGVKHRAPDRKATLNKNGKGDITCKTSIPQQTDGTNSDSGNERGNKGKKPD